MKLVFFILALSIMLPSARGADKVSLPPSNPDEQQKKADVILLYDGPERIYFERPKKMREPFKLPQLEERIQAVAKERAMVVIIMGKPSRMLPDDQFKKVVDDLESKLHKNGFKKIIFHLASAGLEIPIYREAAYP